MGLEGHAKKVEAVRSSGKIRKFLNVAPNVDKMTTLEAKVRRAEVKVTSTLVKHNVPLAFAKHLSPLFYQSVFPLFTRFNKLLQREDPVIYLLHSQMTTFLNAL